MVVAINQMTPEMITALGAAAAAIIIAVGTLVSSIRNGRTIKQVHTLVNGGLIAAKAEIARLAEKVASLTQDPLDIVQAELARREVVAMKAKE